jgi:hypothetical protein
MSESYIELGCLRSRVEERRLQRLLYARVLVERKGGVRSDEVEGQMNSRWKSDVRGREGKSHTDGAGKVANREETMERNGGKIMTSRT